MKSKNQSGNIDFRVREIWSCYSVVCIQHKPFAMALPANVEYYVESVEAAITVIRNMNC